MRYRLLATVAAVLTLFGTAPATAAPTTETQTLKMSGDPHVTSSNPLTLKAKKISEGTLQLACFTFTFEGDLLDPGEGLTITPDGIEAGGGPGFENVSTTSTTTRTLCSDDPAFLPFIADGNSSEKFVVQAESDSTFTLSSVTLTLTYE